MVLTPGKVLIDLKELQNNILSEDLLRDLTTIYYQITARSTEPNSGTGGIFPTYTTHDFPIMGGCSCKK